MRSGGKKGTSREMYKYFNKDAATDWLRGELQGRQQKRKKSTIMLKTWANDLR